MTTLTITNARVATSDPARPEAEAVVLRGDRIAYVGDAAGAAAYGGRAIDAGGATLLPGLIDSHYHLLLGSLRLDSIALDAVHDMAGLREAVLAFAAEHPGRPWLAGYGLQYGAPGGRELTRHDLDAIVADRPLLLTAFDGHTAWANTRALELGGVLRGHDCGANSEVVMGADGLAQGELREPGAFGPLRALIPRPDAAQKRALLRRGLRQAAELGITAVHNMDGDMALMELLQAAERDGDLTLRAYIPYDITPATRPEQIAEALAMRAAGSALVRAGSVKLFLDGVIEGYTGLLVGDYPDTPGHSGEANYPAEQFDALVGEADRLGLQVLVHAVGDMAVRRTLDAYAAARRANGARDARHRVEHIEVIHPDDLPRFAELGVIASMQPYHAPIPPSYGAVWMARAGAERWARSFAWRSLRDAGARLAFGSDWPVVTQDPLVGLAAAVERRAWGPGAPSQAITLGQALAAYTRDAAYAEFQEHERGMLRAGMLADLTLLDSDILAEGADLHRARVRATICGGRVVFDRDGALA